MLPQQLDPFSDPHKFFWRNPVVLGIARLDVGPSQQFEATFLEFGFGRPDADQTCVERLGEVPQPNEIVGFWRVQRQRQKQAIIVTFARLGVAF